MAQNDQKKKGEPIPLKMKILLLLTGILLVVWLVFYLTGILNDLPKLTQYIINIGMSLTMIGLMLVYFILDTGRSK